jgi:hypothetical protein
MPMPNHCIECEKPTKKKNMLCDYCLEKHIELSDCCNALSIDGTIVDRQGICSICLKWSDFNEDTQTKRFAYRF